MIGTIRPALIWQNGIQAYIYCFLQNTCLTSIYISPILKMFLPRYSAIQNYYNMGNHQYLVPYTHTNSYHNNSVIIITGASSGLGKEIALQYSLRKAKLIITGRNATRLDHVKNQCIQNGAKVWAYIGDLTQQEQCKKLVEYALQKFAKIDILVLNAGINAHSSFEQLEDLQVVEELMKTNFYANLYLTKYALPSLKKVSGQIVLISSLSGKFGLPSRSAYCASKFAVTGFFEALRTQDLTIDITVIYPPSLETPMRDHDILALRHHNKKSQKNQNQVRYDPKYCAQLVLLAADHRVQTFYFPLKPYLAVYLYPFFTKTIRQKLKKSSKL